MKADINYKGVVYKNVELASIKEFVVSFRIYTNQHNHNEYVEQLISDGADVDFYNEYAFVVVSRNDVSEIIWL